MSFSVSDQDGGLEYSGASPNGLFADRGNLVRPSFLRMVRDLVRFNRQAPALVGLNGSGPSLGAYLDEGGYSREFIDHLIVPQASAVWSADPTQMWSFPASLLAEFFANHGMFGLTGRPLWRTVVGGSHRYVEKITEPLGERLRLSTPVRGVERFADRVEVTPSGGEPEAFDEVVLATHSDQALGMLADPSQAEVEVLGAIAYQPNEAVLHTDRSLLPKRRRAWASWNYHLLDEPAAQTTVTYHMNNLQSLRSDTQICVTLNRSEQIDPDKVVRKIQYAHPVYTREGMAAHGRWDEVSGVNRTHYCGAWWGYGFHEDGVNSALKVCERFDRSLVT
jgi:predicted NAD/FAD-binding protein